MAVKLHIFSRRAQVYLSSLLKEGRRQKLLSAHEYSSIENAISAFVRTVAPRKKEALIYASCSVRYVMALSLKALPSHDEALEVLKQTVTEEKARALYEDGLRILHRRYVHAASRYVIAKQSAVSIPNLAYQRTIGEQIPAFLRQFTPSYNAHMDDLSLSYPLSVPVQNVTGLSRITRYLRGFYLENKFLARYPQEELEQLYLSFCFGHEFYDVETPIVNLFRMALKNAVFAEYLKCEDGMLCLQKSEVETAQKILKSVGKESRGDILEAICLRLFPDGNPYYKKSYQSILEELLLAIEREKLPNVLVTW